LTKTLSGIEATPLMLKMRGTFAAGSDWPLVVFTLIEALSASAGPEHMRTMAAAKRLAISQ
jgi:hypothetical protein